MRKVVIFVFLSLFFVSTGSCCPGSVISEKFIAENLEEYSPYDISLIKKDLEIIKGLIFRSVVKEKQPIYLATAGGPGSAKSTILETFLIENQQGKNYVYIDPDRMVMRFMVNTYISYLSAYNIAKKRPYSNLLKEAYQKWRGGSNYISGTLFNKATRGFFNVAHGSTSTSAHIEGLYKRLKKRGYKIILLLCGADKRTRLDLINHRRKIQANVQASKEDIINKGKLFPQRLKTYFKYADRIYIYWTQTSPIKSILAAEYSKKKGLVIKDKRSFDLFVRNNGKLPV